MQKGWIDVRFKHPSKDLRYLENALNIYQDAGWVSNDPRKMSNGNVLPAKSYHYWAGGVSFSQEQGFAKDVNEVLNFLQKKEVDLEALISTGGTVEIYLSFQGVVNNGDTIKAEDIKRMGELGINFSIEVFDKIQNDRG